ncbi:BglG family transcription antiterminator [Streptococcus rifensis]
MLLTKREEQLLKAFLQVGKLSLKEMGEILHVSSRTVYRTLSDLTDSLRKEGIEIEKDGRKYFLVGNTDTIVLTDSSEEWTVSHRQLMMTYRLLTSHKPVINDELQEEFYVSNVTVIQDIADIETRLMEFGLTLSRKKGYLIEGEAFKRRRLLAILLSNAISIQDFWNDDYPEFSVLSVDRIQHIRHFIDLAANDLGEIDSKLKQFLTILVSLTDNQEIIIVPGTVSKEALDFSKKLFANLAKESKQFFNLQEIMYIANVLDETIIKRQEVPLFREKFDSEFYYSLTQLVDAVSRFTKIDFFKDKLLFRLLFNHMRLGLAVPILFPEKSTTNIAYLATQQHQFLHSIVSLVMRDIFPSYIQHEFEYELVTLHFASSLRRSPDIYPIRILLLTDERPLTTSVLVSKIKNIAPFVEWIDVRNTRDWSVVNQNQYDYWLTTRPIPNQDIDLISTFPNTQEILELQEKLQNIQEHRTISKREDVVKQPTHDLQQFLFASSHILHHFSLVQLDNPVEFEETVELIVEQMEVVSDTSYLVKKLLYRFELSPLAIPNTNLALLHTQSRTVEESQFRIIELKNPVEARAMNGQTETVFRILVMLTKDSETEEIRELMTAISQSIIENNLYTEIYRTGNQEILYQLLNAIFTEKIKKMENETWNFKKN